MMLKKRKAHKAKNCIKNNVNMQCVLRQQSLRQG